MIFILDSLLQVRLTIGVDANARRYGLSDILACTVLAQSFLGSRAIAGLLSHHHPSVLFYNRSFPAQNMLLAAVAAVRAAATTCPVGFVNGHGFVLGVDALLGR